MVTFLLHFLLLYNMKKYLAPILVSAFLTLGLCFRLVDGNSGVGALSVFGLVVLVLAVLCGIVRLVPSSGVGMQILLFFTQAQIFGNTLLAAPPDLPNWHMYEILTLSVISWVFLLWFTRTPKKT